MNAVTLDPATFEQLKHCLDEREQEVIKLRLLTTPKLTLAAIGQRYKCTRERIRQLQNIALMKLRRIYQQTTCVNELLAHTLLTPNWQTKTIEKDNRKHTFQHIFPNQRVMQGDLLITNNPPYRHRFALESDEGKLPGKLLLVVRRAV